ncbi:hypothetical protein BGZ94_001463 [Podila epigama]|nr:hypothetical protein BGZ94_001463 [Podila epigama]
MALPSTQIGLWLLYVDAIINGMFGAGLMIQPALNAYIADCTAPNDRSVALGYTMVAFSVGITLGPMMGGFYIKWMMGQVSAALILSAGFCVAMSLYCIVVPESLPKSTAQVVRGQEGEMPNLNEPSMPLCVKAKGFVLKTLEPMLCLMPGRIEHTSADNKPPRRYTILLLVVANELINFSLSGITTVFVPYSALVHGWGYLENGIFFTAMGAATFLVYVAIFPMMQMLYKRYLVPSDSEKLGKNDEQAEEANIQSGRDVIDQDHHVQSKGDSYMSNLKDMDFLLFAGIIYFIGFVIVPLFQKNVQVLYIASWLHSLGSVGLPSFLSLFTAYIPVDQTGMALGGICVLDSIVNTVASLLYGWVFSRTSAKMPGAVYVLSAVLTFLVALVTFVNWRTFRP